MELPSTVIKDFAKLVSDKSSDNTNETSTTSVYGTTVVDNGVKYVQIDGSTTLTPIAEATEAEDGDRVLVTIENHKATVIGNFSYPPSARKANEALEKAEESVTLSQETLDGLNAIDAKAQEAKNLASEAKTKANEASGLANEAQTSADEALTKATEAQEKSIETQLAVKNANVKIEELESEVGTVKSDSASLRTEVKNDIETINETITADYAKKTDLTTVEGNLKADINKSVAELQTTMSENYTAKSDMVQIQENLQSQITQNSENISSTVNKVTKLETDTEDIKQDVQAAQNTASAAQTKANEAQAAADTAQIKANEAQAAADQANTKVIEAQAAADKAQSDLDAAKDNLEAVTSRVDATEEEVAEAKTAVQTAQAAADKANADVQTAQAAANNAKDAADKAQITANNAQAAADKAQSDLEALTSRVVTAETKIDQNAEAILLRATKTEVAESLGNYYNKTETDAKIKVSSDTITSSVSKTYATKQEVEDIEIGGRNLYISKKAVDGYLSSSGDGSITAAGGVTKEKTSDFISVDEGDEIKFQVWATIPADSYIWYGYQFFKEDMTALSTDRPAVHEYDMTGGFYHAVWPNPIIVPSGAAYIRVSARMFDDGVIKVEKGTKITDWTIAPEDVEEDVANAQSTADDAKKDIESIDERVVTAESIIQQLSDSISMLVTDGNGASLMTQTENGWTFSMKEINDALFAVSDDLNTLQTDIGGTKNTVNALKQAVTDLGVKASYMTITETDDGKPLIELGTGTSDFKLLITNTDIRFMEGSDIPAYINNKSLYIKTAIIEEELQQSGYVWKVRSNGNYGIQWKGDV